MEKKVLSIEEDIKKRISKASKKIRGVVAKLVEANIHQSGLETQKMLDGIYQNLSEIETKRFNAILIAMNGMIAKKDTFLALSLNLHNLYEEIVYILRQLKDFEDKVTLLNRIPVEERGRASKMINRKTDYFEIVKNGDKYEVKAHNLKELVEENVEAFNYTMSEGRTLAMCLDAYAKEYNIEEFIPSDIKESIEGMRENFCIDPELVFLYDKHTKEKKESNNTGILGKCSAILFEEEFASINLIAYDEAQPYNEMLKKNPIRI